MRTQGAILESLRAGRKNMADGTKREPRIDLRGINEQKKRWMRPIRESKFKTLDEMPLDRAEVVIAFGNGDNFVGEVLDGVPDGQGTIASPDGDMYNPT